MYNFMCWNQEVSLNTFLFSAFGSLLAYFNGVIGLFHLLYFFSFISIQLVEYFTWKYLNNRKLNTLLSKIALALITLQPPFFIMSVKNVDRNLQFVLIGLYAVFAALTISLFNIDYSMHKAQNGHLAWNWLNVPDYIKLTWLSFMGGILLYKQDYFTFVNCFLVIAVVYYTYYKTHTWGSMWCWIGNIFAAILIIQVFLKHLSVSNCLFEPTTRK